LSHPGRSELSQFIVNEREQFLRAFALSRFERLKPSDFAHVPCAYHKKGFQ